MSPTAALPSMPAARAALPAARGGWLLGVPTWAP